MRADPKLADLVLNDLPQEKPCTPEQALSLFVEGNFSKNSYQILRNTAVANGSVLTPPYSVLSSSKLECYPRDMVFTDRKAEVPLQCLLDHTAARLLLSVDPNLLAPLDDKARIVLILKYGMDGMGSQSQFKQGSVDGTMQVGKDKSMFICSTVPLQMSVEGGVVLWDNPTPSS
ncbi:hypothetical protein FOCC_FOCC016077 [Frankliniella occidentalis]|nr:hypothetical protein FOCC_FOCC016077 [Frankliniella occidentalis]